jgi:lipoyl(octanoyl) transferase
MFSRPGTPVTSTTAHAAEPSVQFHLLGTAVFSECLELQRRLARDAEAGGDRRIAVIVCEHPEIITVGRSGSRGDIRLSDEQLRRRGLTVRWVNRGGGCIMHAPGQLAVYPIAPLARCGWSVGQYMGRLREGAAAALNSLGFAVQQRPPHFGVWGRTGLLAALGVAVRAGISRHGLFLNVNPSMSLAGLIDTAPASSLRAGERAAMSCLLAERRQALRMPAVRAALIRHLAAALGCERYHLHTGHPWLRKKEVV